MSYLFLGSIFGFLGVALGAFAAHALKDRLSLPDLEIFKTATLYQMLHALALLAVGMLERSGGNAWVGRAGAAFTIGVLIFSGSLYLLVMTGQRWLGAITPIGGVSLLIGWACLALASLKR